MRAAIVLANGFEEIEAVVPMDILRRGGVDLKVIGLNDDRVVLSSRGFTFWTDKKISDCSADHFDLIILPGGMPGATNLFESQNLDKILRNMNLQGKLIAAICASPAVVLSAKGLLGTNKFTCYPGFENGITDGEFVDDDVVVSNNFITSKGVGTAFKFAFTLLKIIKGESVLEDVKRKALL
ncbi:DJ-1 family glyoxalase III [Borrelia hermsii]|uniref:4-methyl-5(B-hydroxyethyl)-thiazole monophosphate biosynthesis enzyme n=3 Tax=Borrelia hermsii TaxID=140 RepID=A0AAN1CEM7_BORHE|nr:DJ-1 family glyoxalase III [Borrelia hermsii]AAX17123.1 4-methyl-5(B-hydroxyethyl)-thiazole monophosphate biosynthesis enzyme [Borrelia hermsii DAH]AJW73409.1 4-methyl-5(B-hydroxyethyl)-thiazole monophosphate biosynthesis protein [Borrelia hermsii CC1]AMR75236.1 4-methyl-5(B-hydroxyethyl)-thiazole monophosphate biosynthesis enzyme [Borrelia hermsii]ANA43421.1 4-methyl-5(B-hydroxyethyl)-thiazole monophosphate biosynthesis protein [Borrelia hermsii HS1]UCP01625.1 DJ-1/PfpI family protein [Bor